MELSGPNARVFSPVAGSVKVAWLADMKSVAGAITTAFSISESNTTSGNPPSISPYTGVSGDHLSIFMNAATGKWRVDTNS